MAVPTFAFSSRALAAVGPALLVTGCMTETSSAQPVAGEGLPPTEQTCQAEPAKAFIDRRFDAAALQKASGAHQVRKVNPGEAIAMLVMNGRLTVYVDEKGIVTSLSCS